MDENKIKFPSDLNYDWKSIMKWIPGLCCGPTILMIFPPLFKFGENLICSHPVSEKVITMKLHTWHNSHAVMGCTKVCGDIVTRNGITSKWNFHKIPDRLLWCFLFNTLSPEQNERKNVYIMIQILLKFVCMCSVVIEPSLVQVIQAWF